MYLKNLYRFGWWKIYPSTFPNSIKTQSTAKMIPISRKRTLIIIQLYRLRSEAESVHLLIKFKKDLLYLSNRADGTSILIWIQTVSAWHSYSVPKKVNFEKKKTSADDNKSISTYDNLFARAYSLAAIVDFREKLTASLREIHLCHLETGDAQSRLRIWAVWSMSFFRCSDMTLLEIQNYDPPSVQCQATIVPPAKRHSNGGSLAGRCWPAFRCLLEISLCS